MIDSFEDRLRAAIADDLRGVTPGTLRRPTLPAAVERTSRKRVLAVAVVAVAVLAVCGVGVVVTRSRTDAAPVTVTGSQISVQNAIVPIPQGLTAIPVEDPAASFYHYCLVWPGTSLGPDNDCVVAGGIDVRVAKVDADGNAAAIPGLLPPRCPEMAQTWPSRTDSAIGSVKADLLSIVCGPDQNASPNSLFWMLADRTLIIQSPFDGDLQEAATRLAAEVDLDDWPHTSQAAAAEPASTSAETSTGPAR